MTKDEALKMAIKELSQTALGDTPALKACKEALEQPVFDYNTAFSHGYEAHRVEQELEQPAQEPTNVGTIGTFPLPKVRYESYQWQGLSDDEIMNIARESYMSRDGGDIKFARAIEAKLKENNHD